MKIAQLVPRKVPAMLSVPPVRREGVQQQDDPRMDFSDKQPQKAQPSFHLDCNKFYCGGSGSRLRTSACTIAGT
ncbi:hypothetical protein BWQ96_08569 [Gracilariopsis chorda]|uniref:Uncharacterized protein n=1 Tax=Gracilariopsis chorda TaxID=448386 RepID=A0A2V3IHZ8_9FLOR|nr:hypothetical protein BWQ96_08569 [Gracilariopsis chorda]|eukprot:PXF41707.1 hypothetical protein BWQ96_08569 [Gracilariopsis chorda]